MKEPQHILRAGGLEKSYRGRKVVNQVELELPPATVVGLLGPNGAGKTTVFYMMVGLVFPDMGNIHMGDRNITNLPLFERARLGIGYLAQEPSLFRKLSVEDNIAMALESMGVRGSELKDRVHELIHQFNLAQVAKSPGSALSGGERRRCEIARCLAIDPKYVLLDEPFAGIDPIAVADIQSMIRSLKDRGIGVLITDHNVRDTLKICDRGYLMRDGQIFLHGTPEQISDNPEARRFYLGDSFRLN